MINDAIHIICFLGIGGIGMSALARYFIAQGKTVFGYDRTSTDLTRKLESEGIRIIYVDDPGKFTITPDLVIYTPAIPKSSKLYNYYADKQIRMMKRSQVLGNLSHGNFTIAVAGTHGKTTITSMIAHILKSSGANMTALVGGICKNYGSNYISGGTGRGILVVEADEYDRSFHWLHPDLAIVSAIDPDHLDIYHSAEEFRKSFRTFMAQTKEGGKVIISKYVDIQFDEGLNYLQYGFDDSSISAKIISTAEGCQHIEINGPGFHLEPVRLSIPGSHNVLNATAAASACFYSGIEVEEIRNALESYEGVSRRFDYRVKNDRVVYIDDYAHHPEEIRACIKAVREVHPGRKITGIFQPHLFTRTRDFADGFAESLDQIDEVILLEIYPAREEPIEGVTSLMVLERMRNKNAMLTSKNELLEVLKSRDINVLLTIGAGDIDQLVVPIENYLKSLSQ